MSVRRFDFQRLQKAQKLDNGFLKAPVYATRVGVFRYVKPDGSILRELRPSEEVFDQASMQSLAGVPVTNRHPAELVDSKNSKRHMVGYTSDVIEKEAQFVKTAVTITDDSLIKEIEAKGLREVSCGYQCELEFTSGVFDGEEYDAIQRNIRYNHLAVVDKGRAGPQVRLHLDADDAVLDDEGEETKPNPKEDAMAKLKIGDVEYECDGGLAKAVQDALKDAKKMGFDEAMGKMSKEKKDSEDALQAKVDGLQAKVDELTTENKKLTEDQADEKKVRELVIKRTALVEKSKKFLAADVKIDEMSDMDIKKAVITAKNPDLKLDDKSEAYIEGRFDSIVEGAQAAPAKKDDKLADAMKKTEEARKDGDKVETAEEVRARNMKADSDAWQKPIGFHLQ